MTSSELSAVYEIRRTLEIIKAYCENRMSCSDREYGQWQHVASEADYGLIKVRDIEGGAK